MKNPRIFQVTDGDHFATFYIARNEEEAISKFLTDYPSTSYGEGDLYAIHVPQGLHVDGLVPVQFYPRASVDGE